jgi:hypothetical protein
MQPTCRTAALVAWVLTAACDGPDRVTAAPPPAARPSRDVTVGPAQPPVNNVYTLTDISGGLASRATDVNNDGWVVGAHTIAGAEHGFVRHPDGTVEDIPPLPGDVGTVVTGINDANQIVGTSTAPNGSTRAWHRDPGQPVGALFDGFCGGAIHANAIDDAGEIAGGCAGTPVVWFGIPQNTWRPTGITGDFYDIGGHTPVGTMNEPVSTTAALAFGPSGATTLDMPYATVKARINGVNGARTMVGAYTVGTTERGFWATFDATHPLPHAVYGISGPGRMVGWYVSIPSVAYTIAPNGIAVETPLPPANRDRAALRVNRCGTIVGHYFPAGLQGGARAAMWTKPVCD